jgi:uncharacterized protein (DUF2062 family)/predicted LPLAT superfamily acyltransferase
MIMRICVVIPYFENPRTISEVVKEVVLQTPFPVLVVDDGSQMPLSDALYSFEVKQALESGRVRLKRFDRHQGKGAALQYAIQDLVALGFTHMMTMDGDGLHLPRELHKLVDAGRRDPWALILGNRGLEKPQATGWLKRSLNRLLSYCIRFETGSQIQDSRSGFRLYPLFSLQTMRFRTKSYEFELEVLIRLLWNRVRVQEVEVATAAFDPNEHITHFHRFWDSLRLSALNLVLLAMSLLKTHNAPGELAVAVGLGVFVGCTPIFGFHTILVAILAVTLRLNFVALWLGTHVSTPVIWPLVLWAELYIGQHWLGIGVSTGMMGHVQRLIGGSLVLGVILSLPSALLTYWGALSIQREESPMEVAIETARRRHLPRFMVRRLGLAFSYFWMGLVSKWRYLTHFQARRGLAEFYRVVQPGLGFWSLHRRVLRHFRRAGEMQIDGVAREMGLPEPHGQALEGVTPETLVLTGHVGNWDLAVARGANLPERLWADRPSAARIELFPFLGRLVPLDVGAFWQAAEKGVPLMTSFGVKNGDGGYHLHSRPAREYQLKRDSAAALQVYDWAARFALQYEFVVRKHPEQWMNLYPFFSSPPRLTGVDEVLLFEDLLPLPRLRPEN